MAFLAQIPSDILAIVTSSLNGFDISRLWLSGDLSLLSRLKHGGVTRFELALAQEINCNWPKLISQFSCLQSLIIRPKDEFHRIWFREVDFSGISSTLKHLELEFDNLEVSLFGLPFLVFDPHPDPIWSPPTEGEMIVSPFPLETHFCRLETIIFRGNMKFPSLLVPMLPSGLLYLYLPYEAMDASVVRQLPPNLTRMELPYLRDIEIGEIGIQLPCNLTHLDLPRIYLLECMSPTPLPPSLVRLSASLRVSKFSSDTVLQLPRTLTTLIDSSWLGLQKELFEGALPLRHLRAPNQQLTLVPKNLPYGLQTLVVGGENGISDSNVSQLPPTLTELRMYSSSLSSIGLLSLPTCLRSLSIRISFLDTGTPYPFMPNLEFLDVSTLDASALSFAPKLRYLEIYRFSLQSPPHLRHLTSLTSLTIGGGTMPQGEAYPDSLKSLKLAIVDSPRSFQLLPRGLKRLFISVRCDLSEQSMAFLPPGLTDLFLPSCKFEDSLSDASIALLPQSLKSLKLGSAQRITDNGIAKLPRGLRYCNLSHANLLTDNSIPLFPRQLTSLEVSDPINLSNVGVKHLPRTLTRFNAFDSTKLTSDCFPELPPRLAVFTLKNPVEWLPSISKAEHLLSSLVEEAKKS